MTASPRKKALVAGASSGIGAAVVRRFAADGFDICGIALDEPGLRQVIEMLPAGDHFLLAGDGSDPEFSERIERALRERWGRLDVLVNSAGISRAAHAIETPLAEWRVCFDVMVNIAVYLSRAAVKLMDNGGRIIHLTSIHGDRSALGASSYGMAKAAVNQWCRALAVELADRGILVNAIAPGFVDTPMSRATGENELETEWFRQNYVAGEHLPLRRAARPEEIAGVAAFLAGPDATYITGHVLVVDGGLTITF